MLRNEFSLLEELLVPFVAASQLPVVELSPALCARVRQSWEDAVLSEVPEHSLVRYFSYQLELLIEMSDHFFKGYDPDDEDDTQTLLLNLIDHLHTYFPCYFNDKARVPHAYQIYQIKQYEQATTLFRHKLESTSVTQVLVVMISKYLECILTPDKSVNLTFQNIKYFIRMLGKLRAIDFDRHDAEEVLVNQLILQNFNHLSYFVFLQQRLRLEQEGAISLSSKLVILGLHKVTVCGRPEANDLVYDPAWPSLKTMLSAWLDEEILQTERLINNASKIHISIAKIPIELPVTQLAYLTRLLVEESVFGILNLQSLFKFYADHFQTKRQSVISPGGFSKAYYSADQQTAARVMALLQKIIARIKRDFFLVMVAACITAHFYPGTH